MCPCSASAPARQPLSDATKIILERRIAELRIEILAASKRGKRAKAAQVHNEIVEHQLALGFIPDDTPPDARARRKKKSGEPIALAHWPSLEEVRKPLMNFAVHWDGQPKMKISELAHQVR